MKLTPIAITLSALLFSAAQVNAEEGSNKKPSRYQTTESVSRSVYHSQQSAADIAQGKVTTLEPAAPVKSVAAQPTIAQPIIEQPIIVKPITTPKPQVTAAAKAPVLLAKPLAGLAPKQPLVAVEKPVIAELPLKKLLVTKPLLAVKKAPTPAVTKLPLSSLKPVFAAESASSPSLFAAISNWFSIEPVKPWQKGTLAKKAMKPGGPVPEFDVFSEKVFAYKQGSIGGNGVGGGGCGCN